MKHATHCKFCKSPITIEIDDEYSKLGDPFKLIGMASCNRCADLRTERRCLEGKIKRVCMILALSANKDKSKLSDSVRDTLTDTPRNTPT